MVGVNTYAFQDEWHALAHMKAIRERSLSIAETAKRMGVTRQAVSRFERSIGLGADHPDFRQPSLSMLRLYVEALGLQLLLTIVDSKGGALDFSRYTPPT